MSLGGLHGASGNLFEVKRPLLQSAGYDKKNTNPCDSLLSQQGISWAAMEV